MLVFVMGRTAAALIIGNEILSGKTQDANTFALANELRSLGIELRRVVVVPDEIDVIAGEVNSLRATHDFLFTSGGVGPTHDDVTIEAVARALGRRVVRFPAVEKLLRDHYRQRTTEGHLRMADLVEGMELLLPPDGGSWPTFVLGNVFVLPGVPEIFRLKLGTLRAHLASGDPAFVLRSVYTRGDEGEIKHWIDEVVGRFHDVSIGSYPRFRDDDHNVRVTFDGRNAERVAAAASAFVSLLPSSLVVRVD